MLPEAEKLPTQIQILKIGEKYGQAYVNRYICGFLDKSFVQGHCQHYLYLCVTPKVSSMRII